MNLFRFLPSLVALAVVATPLTAATTDNAVWRRLFDSWKAPCDPFRIAANVHYVGATGVSAFLITTPEGHVLVDTGFEETVGVIRTNVARLGFRWQDIKIMVASHAHVDHVGGHALMKELTGARIVMSEADAALLASGGTNDLGVTATNQIMAYRPARADRIVRDGDTVSLGGVALTCHLTPGHTRGATTWTMAVEEAGQRLNVVFFSSLSLLEGTRLLNNPKYPQLAEDYRATFAKLRTLPCDIFLAPHGGMFGLAEKSARLAGGGKPNPFIDHESLFKAVADAEKAVDAQLAKERSAAAGNEAVVRRYFEEWANHGDTNAADALLATNVVLRHPHVTVNGLATYKQSMATFHAAFPDLHYAVEDQVTEGEKVLVRWLLTGTQRGDFQGHPAEGRAIRVAGMSLFRLDEGKVHEIWVNMDRLGLQQQLGWLPALGTTNASSSPGYFELRLYIVTSNKMGGVLERFGDTVEPVRRRHGITTIGYWSAPGTTNGGTFAYLMAAASKEELQKQEKEFGADPQFKEGYAASNKKHGKTVEKIAALPLTVDATAKFDFASATAARAFDLRIYSVLPGKLDAFRNRWREFAVPIYKRHGLHSIGWWVAEKKDADGNDQFICLLAAESIPAILKSISEFHQDADWQRVEKETEQDGKLRSGVEAFKLVPADFSPLK